MTILPVHDIKKNSDLLRSNKSLKNLYDIIAKYDDTEAAVWLENGEIQSLTYSDYIKMTRNYAAFLHDAIEAEPDSYVVISMDTCKEWFPVFWGVIQAGYNAVLVDVNQTDDMVNYQIQQSGAKAIITTVQRPMLDPSVRYIDANAVFQAPETDTFTPGKWGDHAALCTSGTTGTSRIFEYNGEAIVEQVLSSELLSHSLKRAVSNKNFRSFAFLPYHHVFGFIVNLMWSCFLGYSNIYPANRTPQAILETAQKCQPQLFVTVPLVANNFCTGLQKKLAKESVIKRALFHTMKAVSLGIQRIAPDFGLKVAEKVFFGSLTSKLLGSSISCIILGGAYTPMEHLKLLNAVGYYTICGFGMTETAITSVETSLNLSKRISGSVGKPLSNVEYRVKPGDGHGRRGEMFIRGKSLHTGRLVDGKRMPPDTIDGGWYPTGDVVRLERGDRMFVEGRVKDVIINESGENVYPDELDNVFSAMAGVEQSTVLGVLKPGKKQKYEDIVLVMNVGAAYKDDAYLETLMQEINTRNAKLPTLKRLSRVIVTPEPLPLVNGIKVKRFALKALIEENKLAYRDLRMNASKVVITEAPKEVVAREVQPSDLQLEEIKQKVRALYSEALDIDAAAIGDDQHFIDELDGDSLQVLSAALKTEEQFSITIPVEEYGQCTTVNDMSALIYAKLNGRTAYEKQGQPDEAIQPIERFEDAPEYIAFKKRIESLEALGGQNPYFVCHESPLRDTSIMDGREALNFGSYNYAGMSGRPEVVQAAKDAIDKYGTSDSGSRLLAGEKELNIELEKEIADWKHTEDALVLVGGHSTNVTFVGNFCDQNDLILYDVLAHNSIEQGCRLSRATTKPFPHNDSEALERILRVQRERYAKMLIIIEGAYSMDGDIADVPAFVAVKKKYGCFLLVDEAHSACVIGETGGGVDEYFGLAPDDVDIKMGTLSKGLGTCGGYLAGSKALITYLRYSLPGFVFSVGISPPLAGATLKSIRLLRENPQIMKDMKRNIDFFVAEAKKRNLDICLAGHSAIIPVLVGQDEHAFYLSNKMRENGVFVPPAVYPAVPKNKARLRFCVISEHKPEQILKALDTLVKIAKESGIKLPSPQ
ncbi:MAG TPA: aminotransferase class I/II-fold pyridoxal phosphate-dependent enzyme [Candidatus Limiplasma sp.]|nr:aminotransferase class I/II-fold pyridoxal phosphate-dependent enzyme [Candidatus Limiplasma sp.]